MGVSVHLLVINELELARKHYGWLTFAEGKKFEAFREQLTDEITHDETYQTYLDILRELEQEGKERMADEVISRIINEMPTERFEKLVFNMSEDRLQKTFSYLSAERLQQALAMLSAEKLQQALTGLPQEKLRAIKDTLNQIELN